MNRTIYVKPEAEPVYRRAQELAAEHGVSLSDVISGLLALMVDIHDGRDPVTFGASAVSRLMSAEALAGDGDDCDRCGQPGALLRGDLDLTGTRMPALVVERLCGSCRDLDQGWPL